ncbi:sensor histidine kinase [Roseivivax sp. THAF30]|jgi:two-component sensor histidine kinase|uniref:sensor histidine kinase n=1 Tax=Roseivivax sp. THAF30 TaxID=2587852 RepID=UPI001268F266|nr:histidine kinase dimerization/phosphoacceptor domain -containing protein [Roseivivax sp. THAF30]QFT62891.1 Blue-light-activated histidine kinase 2 [Roseivivax sp. THAF30]
MRASAPENQEERLAELREFSVLETGPEDSFEDIAQLIRDICDVPTALVSLVEEDRQWFKARIGFEYPETPIDRAICAHTILSTEILEIPDTQADPRTADNPLCRDGETPVRFYAGAPLVSDRGHALGTLCVLDTRPRTLEPHQRRALKALASQVMRLLELRRTLQAEEMLRSEMDHRVKNSLQTVSSFIRIYSSRAQHEETKDALDAIARRVNAIAQLHAELYQTNQFNDIQLDQYLTRVTELLSAQVSENVRIETDFAPVSTESRTAAQIAMIVSEFAANASKHAFPDDRRGIVSLRVTRLDGGGLELVCEDNGIGNAATPIRSEQSEIASIGMRLMESAAEQIGGRVEMGAGADGYRLSLVIEPQGAEEPHQAAALSAE